MRYGGRPAYVRIADDLREQIHNGRLAAGAPIPSESEIMLTYLVSRQVAKMAAASLIAEGLVTGQPGKGRYVRQTRDVMRLARNRYTRSGTPPFASDALSVGATPQWEHRSEVIEASPSIADRLHIDPGDRVVATHYSYTADRRPIQLADSFEPCAIVGGTPIELPEAGPIRGVIARMDSIGCRVTEVTEEVTARAPLPHERIYLDIAAGVSVMNIARTHWVQDTPVETCDIVIPADRYALVYRMPVEG